MRAHWVDNQKDHGFWAFLILKGEDEATTCSSSQKGNDLSQSMWNPLRYELTGIDRPCWPHSTFSSTKHCKLQHSTTWKSKHHFHCWAPGKHHLTVHWVQHSSTNLPEAPNPHSNQNLKCYLAATPCVCNSKSDWQTNTWHRLLTWWSREWPRNNPLQNEIHWTDCCWHCAGNHSQRNRAQFFFTFGRLRSCSTSSDSAIRAVSQV